jgi:hypothetical protein
MEFLICWGQDDFAKKIDALRHQHDFDFFGDYINRITGGDIIWMFATEQSHFVLVAKVLIAKAQCKKTDFGSYAIYGWATFYETSSQNERFEQVIRSLGLSPIWNDKLYVHFQGTNSVRKLEPEDNAKIDKFAGTLQLWSD